LQFLGKLGQLKILVLLFVREEGTIKKNWQDRISIVNGLVKGDALSPLLFNFALAYAIRRVHSKTRMA
jgi:hypothetical protein